MARGHTTPAASTTISVLFIEGSALDKFEPLKVLLRPARLLDHALQRFALESAVPAVKDHCDAAAVWMIKNLVRPVAAVIAESVTDER